MDVLPPKRDLGNDKSEMKYSVCSTVYNNASRVELCLNSIIRALEGLDFEIVVVDNYSTDGTYEILLEYVKRHGNIKVLRRRCSRGLGRQFSFLASKGRYIIPIDMDTEYNSEKLRQLLIAYEQSSYKDVKCVKPEGSIGIYPRHILKKVGGWRDYNMGEDFDLLARLCLADLVVFVPVSLSLNEPCEEPEKKGVLKFEVGIIGRERRYAKGYKTLLRALRNKMDFYCAWGYTLRKLILRHRDIGINSMVTLFSSILLILSKL